MTIEANARRHKIQKMAAREKIESKMGRLSNLFVR